MSLPLRVSDFLIVMAGLAPGFMVGAEEAPATQAVDVLPAPAGAHAVGRMSFHWRDDTREELETRAGGDKRELVVHLFYPAAPNSPAPPAVYVPDAAAMRGAWNDTQLQRIAMFRVQSRESAAILPGATRFPVIVFAPGGGMKALTYHALLEDLASHGWVVAAIDPAYNARGVRFPDGRVLGNLPPAERAWPQTRDRAEERRFYRERVTHWARDMRFVIDRLTALDAGSGPFARRLDLARGVGALGHSRGGQAAATVRLIDPRVRGAINLDGMAGDSAVISPEGDEASGRQPFLWIHKALPPPPSDAQLARAGRTRAEFEADMQHVLTSWARQLRAIEGGAWRVELTRAGIAHIDFSDEPFWDGSMTPANHPGRVQTITETRRWVRAFFDGAVRGEWTALRRLTGEGSAAPAETVVHRFGKG